MSSQINPSTFLCSMLSSKEDELGFPLFSSMGSIPRLSSKEDDMRSMISNATTAAAHEGSASNSIAGGITSASAAARLFPMARQQHHRVAETGSSSSARFKGVVLQQNGHWGAQIYAHHNRIWLGTFKSERAAAMAYDSAAIKLHRGSSHHRNFPWTELTIHEPTFQDFFTTEAVLNMIKDGSYESNFAEFLRITQTPKLATTDGMITAAAPPRDVLVVSGGTNIRELFQKELTPSDVGKLNRLVIPKKHATRYLPPVSSDAVEELLLEFRDRENRVWVFRYCYWKSSQSYVFTKGWNKFVKEKELRTKDVVGFYQCEEREGQIRTYRMIDIVRNNGVGAGGGDGEGMEELEFCLGREGKMEIEDEGEEVVSGPAAAVAEVSRGGKEVKLFGVWIG